MDLNALVGPTDSLSKGVFTFGGKGAAATTTFSSGKKRKGKGRDVEYGAKAPRLYGGSSDSYQKRCSMFKEMWAEATRVMETLQSDNHSRIVDQILLFVKESAGAVSKNNAELPTACILTGFNVPDHEDFFKHLKSSLLKSSTPHVASVSSKNCSATVRSFFKVAVRQLVMKDDDEDVKVRKRSSPTALRSWYNNQYEKGDERPPLVIVLQDFEMFVSKALQDFVHTLRLLELPVVLIFGVATTVEAVHKSLPHSVTSHLAIRKYSSVPSIELLGKLMDRLVMNNVEIPFKLGPQTLKLLLETFMFHDFSVKHFLTAYKYCLLEHFTENRFSVLCCKSASELKASLSSNPDVATSLKTLPSFESWKENDDHRDDERDFDELAVDKLISVATATQKFNLFVRCLWDLVTDIPGQSLGKYYHSVYNLALAEPVQNTREFRDAFQFLALSERTTMEAKLRRFRTRVQGCSTLGAARAADAAQGLLAELDEIDDSSVAEKDEDSPLAGFNPQGKLDRFKLQEVLLERAKEKKKRRQSPFDAWRSKVLDFYHATFKDNLASPLGLVFHEVFYFENAPLVRLRLQGNPRVAIQKALQAPHFYLHNSDVKVDSLDEISSALPDVCIAYKLHLECGRYINLADWYQCWLSIVKAGREEDDGAEKALYARFSRSVSELQFLGFVRPSKRKTDHVERLTWN